MEMKRENVIRLFDKLQWMITIVERVLCGGGVGGEIYGYIHENGVQKWWRCKLLLLSILSV